MKRVSIFAFLCVLHGPRSVTQGRRIKKCRGSWGAHAPPLFSAWYVEEHLDMLLRSPYWPACRRYRIQNPGAGAWTHVALHYLTDLRALESPERDAARSTPWRARLDKESWFRGEYHPYYRCRQLGA